MPEYDLTLRVKANGPRDAKIAVIGMAPAREEMKDGVPFVGPSGRIFNNSLSQAGVNRRDVFVTNAVNFFVPDNNILGVPAMILAAEIQRVKKEIEEVNPNVIMILGDQTVQLLLGRKGITKWRGSILPWEFNGRTFKSVPAMHPAAFIRGQWKWLPVFTHIDLKRVVEQSKFPEIEYPRRVSHVGPSFKQAVDWLRHCNDRRTVSIDIEGYDDIACIGAGDQHEAMCIPFKRSGLHPHYWDPAEELEIWKHWTTLLQNHRVGKIMQNGSFEIIHFWCHGIYPYPLYVDTMHLHHCLYPDFGGVDDEWTGRRRSIDNPGHGLAFLTSQYTLTPFYKDDGRKWDPSQGDDKFWTYNCTDVMVTAEIAEKMVAEATSEGLWPDLYEQHYRRYLYHSLLMEWDGVLIDVSKREAALKEARARLKEIEGSLFKALGFALNVNSPKQVAKLLYQIKKFQPRINPKTKRPTADKDTLNYFAQKYADKDPSLALVLEQRQLQDLISDVLTSPLDKNNRTHSHYKLGGTDGTRWSSTKSILGSGTNLQNVPRRGIARELYLPD